MQQMKRVLVFSTSLESEDDIRNVKPALDHLVGTNGRWNFDLEDCDCILRVETPMLPEPVVIAALQNRGYTCTGLE